MFHQRTDLWGKVVNEARTFNHRRAERVDRRNLCAGIADAIDTTSSANVTDTTNGAHATDCTDIAQSRSERRQGCLGH